MSLTIARGLQDAGGLLEPYGCPYASLRMHEPNSHRRFHEREVYTGVHVFVRCFSWPRATRSKRPRAWPASRARSSGSGANATRRTPRLGRSTLRYRAVRGGQRCCPQVQRSHVTERSATCLAAASRSPPQGFRCPIRGSNLDPHGGHALSTVVRPDARLYVSSTSGYPTPLISTAHMDMTPKSWTPDDCGVDLPV